MKVNIKTPCRAHPVLPLFIVEREREEREGERERERDMSTRPCSKSVASYYTYYTI